MPTCPKCRETNPELGAKCPRDGYYYIADDALDEAARDPKIGTLAAEKFVVIDLISEGGMGAVYRALQLPIQREVALKVLRAELEDSDKGRERFEREARAIARLNHPNIITLHDFGFDDGHPYMVMEYAPGRSLAHWLLRPGIKLGDVLHVMRQMLAALAAAHEMGIVHRDLKPDNVIVTRTSTDESFVKLLDFGIARIVTDGATRGLTQEGEVFGTPHYMAPEQAQGKNDIGPAADIYALGIMFYEMLCGEAPFDAPTPVSVLFMQVNDDLPPLEPRNGLSVPPAIEAVVRKATAKEAADRYADAASMLSAIDAAFDPVSGQPKKTRGGYAIRVTDEQRESPEQMATAPTMATGELEAIQPDHPAARTGSSGGAGSNGVAVHDPAPTADFGQFEGNRRGMTIVAVLAVLVLLGIGVTGWLLSGDETEEVAAATTSAGTVDPASDEPADGQGAGEDSAVDEAGEQARADRPTDEPAEPSGAKAAGPDTAGDDEAKAAGDDAEPERAAAEPAQPKPAAKPEPEAKPEPKPPREGAAQAAPKEARTEPKPEPQKTEEPRRFEPRKFRKASPKDDDAEVTPRKWR